MTTAYKQIKNAGFTLIELLIVMAILGVLAVVVLVAIDPVQQLARTRDAGRQSSVSQLGHAVEAYYATHNGTYPTDLATLAASGELTDVPQPPTNTLGVTECGTQDTSGWCYTSNNTAAAVWIELESNSSKGFCGGAGNDAFAAYLTSAGKACIGCSDPGAGTTQTWCQND